MTLILILSFFHFLKSVKNVHDVPLQHDTVYTTAPEIYPALFFQKMFYLVYSKLYIHTKHWVGSIKCTSTKDFRSDPGISVTIINL